MIVGPSLKNISDAYVILNDGISLRTTSCTSAVEICIQCIGVFGIKYSAISNHVWYTAENLGFGFKSPQAPNLVANVVSEVKKQKIEAP